MPKITVSMVAHLTGLAVDRHCHPHPPLLDGACPGLRLVALKPQTRGARLKSWIYRYRTKAGRLRQIKLGMYPRMTLAAARKAWGVQKTIRDDPGRGDPRGELQSIKATQKADAVKDRRDRYTVAALCDAYLREHVQRNRKRADEPRRLMNREVIPAVGQLPAHALTRTEVHEIIQTIVKRGANRVAHMVRNELRAAYEHAVTAGRLPETHANPCSKVKAPPQRRRTRAFTDAELSKFCKWLPIARVSRSVRDAMHLEILTAARQGEIVGMRWADIDLRKREWHQTQTKNRRSNTVMLSDQAIEILKNRVELNRDWVFPLPYGAGHIASKAIGIQQYAAKTELHIPDWTVHDLRRSALTGLARLGCPRVVQDRIANHVDRSMAAIYDRYDYDAEARKWLQDWADHVGKINHT